MLSDEQRGELYEFFRAQLAVVTIADHVESMIAQARVEERERAVKVMRETISKNLNLHFEQRAYSWHEIQDTMGECDKAIRARKDGQ